MASSSRVRGVVLATSIAVATPAAAQSTDGQPPPPPPPPPAGDKPPAPPPPPPARPMSMQPSAGQSAPPPRRGPARAPRRGPRDAMPPRGVPIASAPTFHRLPDDSTRISVEVDSKVGIAENHPKGRLVYRFKGTFVPERVNRLPLVTDWFPTPVERAYLVQQGPDVDLVIELREATTPAMKVTETPRGIVLQVDFPRTQSFDRKVEVDSSQDRARKLHGRHSPPPAPGTLVDPPPPPPGGSPDKPPPDEPEKPRHAPSPRERVVGFGSAFGGGVQSVTTVSSTGSTTLGGGVTGALLLPSFELKVFLPQEYSINLTVPVANMVLISTATSGYYLSADLTFNINAGKGGTRFLLGAGVGFTAARYNAVGSLLNVSSPTVAVVRVPGELGVEFLSRKRNFGFALAARPWLDIAPSAATDKVGGGALAVLQFTGYVTRGDWRGSVSAPED